MKQLSTFLLLLYCLAAQAQNLTLCVDELGMPPYYQIEGGELTGILINRAKTAAEQIGLNLTIKIAPFKRCLVKTVEGQYDGILAAVYTKTRAEQLAYPAMAGKEPSQGATNFAPVSIFVHNNSNISWDGKQFHNITSAISAPKGWWINDYFKGNKFHLDEGLSPSKGIQLAALNKISGYIIYDFYGWHEAKKLGVENSLRTVPIPELSYAWYMPFNIQFHQKNKKLVEAFWQLNAD